MAKCSKNSEGYADSTAGLAIHRVSKEEKSIKKMKQGTIPDPWRQVIGRRSKAAGETFERWLSEACGFYLHILYLSPGNAGLGSCMGTMRKKDSRIIKGSCVTAPV